MHSKLNTRHKFF